MSKLEDHKDHDLIYNTKSEEDFRSEVIDGVVHINKNVWYEISETSLRCNDCDVVIDEPYIVEWHI